MTFKPLRQWLYWKLWGERRFKRDEHIRKLAFEEVRSFYLWAVAHDGIVVPTDDQLSYKRWNEMTDKAKKLMTQ